MNLLRPAFDAAWHKLLLTPLAITAAQRDALWDLLVPAHEQTAAGRQRFTSTAYHLLEPLRKEINTAKSQRKIGRFNNKVAKEPGKPDIDLAPLHGTYVDRIAALRERIDAVLRANGHYCTPDDEAFAQPIEVIVANERAAGRPAGVSNWTQWEDPAVVRKLTRVFAAGPKAARGANWSPYLPFGTRRRGAAAEQKATKLWRGVFNDAIHAPLQALRTNPDAYPLARFYQSLKDRRPQQHIEDAIATQVAAHKTPANPAFRNNIWLALDQGTRAAMADDFHRALLECREQMLAKGDADAAAGFDPAVTPNPWALTEDEVEFRQPAAKHDERPATVDDRASTSVPPDRLFDTPSTGGALGNIIDENGW